MIADSWKRANAGRSGRGLPLAFLATILLLGGLWWAVAAYGNASADEAVFVRYVIDRQAVPAWVTQRDLTLRISVGSASGVWAWGDGRPLAVRHDRDRGLVWVTTAASEVLLAAQGAGISADASVGDYALAALKDDKLWAYSITFDDGALSVYSHAWPELTRYDYRAGIAVIGQWLEREDALAYNYCGPDELRALRDVGWSIFNHSYSHYNSPSDITFDDAWRCQEAIRTQLDGYRCTVFTVPYTNREWVPVIDENHEALGLYLMQLMSENGDRLTLVDDPILLAGRPFRMGRDDIKNWVKDGYNYFGQAHASAMAGRHAWVSLHGHSVLYDRDWCALSESSASLYHAYGPAGTDEVWVAPADEVFQYLLTRSYAQVRREPGLPRPLGPQVRAPITVVYRQGVDGFTGWRDTYISKAEPVRNHESEGRLVVWAGGDMRSSTLIRVALPPMEDAVVLHATLSLYAMRHTNTAGVDLTAYPLSRPWTSEQASWLQARVGEYWAAAGAQSVGNDRSGEPTATMHIENCSTVERWHTFDVTEMVARWAADPEANHGLIIEGPAHISKGTTFASADHVFEWMRPLLVVRYGWPTEGPILVATETPTTTPTATATASPSATATPTATPSPSATATRTPYRVNLPLLSRARKSSSF
ncbi:MAG: DNRLRE domain-containing protein [Chloroflexi bacterium]|nr:DNRLRE domain-containing protein [Chloroflexota bacterium]